MRDTSYYIDYQWIMAWFIISLLGGCNSNTENRTEKEHIVTDTIPDNLEFFKGETDYTIVLVEDSVRRVLSFRKHKDSSIFQYINYQTTHTNKAQLTDEVRIIHKLWDIADDSIIIQPKGLMVGYPLEYSDVLRNQVNAFENEPEFEINDYQKLRKIMVNNHVYEPVEKYLKSRNLRIEKISTEKHGFVPKEDLLELGFPDSLKIPVPFMVWLDLKSTNN